MTEVEWNAGVDSRQMLILLQSKASHRKLRLFAAACCRQTQPLMAEKICRETVETAEQYADGTVSDESREVAQTRAYDTYLDVGWMASRSCMPDAFRAASVLLAESMIDVALEVEVLRCIFGNPFRRLTVDPSWQSPTVVSIAQAIYAERAFDLLPILADALEDAGCDNPDILNHCRQPGNHVRGCWPVDLLLAKK